MKTASSLVASALVVTSMIVGNSIPVVAQWTEANGPYSSTIYGMASAGRTLVAGWPKGVFVSTDDGANWASYNNLLTNAGAVCLAAVPEAGGGTNFFASYGYGGPYISTDYGKTWTQRPIGQNYGVWSLAVSGSKLFAGTNNGAFISSDNGLTWDTVCIALPQNYRPICFAFGSKVFMLSQLGVVLSTDAGNTWSVVDSALKRPGILAASGSDLYTFADSVLRSSDDGRSWTSVTNNLPITPYNQVSALAASGNMLFVGTSAKGLFRSTDRGATWASISDGLPNNGVPNNLTYTTVYSLAITDSFLLVGFNQGGIWRRPLSQMTASVEQRPTVRDRESFLPYPNPASTAINMDGLEGISEVRILDATGRQVLSQKIADARVLLDVSGLASGVYSAILTHTNGAIDVRRFSVLH
ncbi:MAG: T9SS type A sorting domain-containing protein [Bacteroidota bacterium]|nr:T9SS type A sorting domain-containing protein [Bacteroidota bacterium]MDP4233583.1 T9SS type A sorting domain-containing protein [Bacteroidota bacterium]MDP4243643.1 T9SS type A sorting domain-containing protein [Bacteroidota bacterium]MDP4287770.1 T9SS type A sorting domain-containing protein [Bacteroidota bacterium]